MLNLFTTTLPTSTISGAKHQCAHREAAIVKTSALVAAILVGEPLARNALEVRTAHAGGI